MKKDKWSKDFRPGIIGIEKQEREQRKQRGLAKKVKKQAKKADAALKEVVFGNGKIIANGKMLGEVRDVKIRMKDRKFEDEYLNVPVDIETDPYGKPRFVAADYASLEKRIMADEQEEKLERVRPEPGLNRMRVLPLGRPSGRDFEDAVSFLFQAIAAKEHQPRPMSEVEREFEGLMENHERLMNHFK